MRFHLAFFLSVLFLILAGCRRGPGDGLTSLPDVGRGYSSFSLHAPWDGRDNDTRFDCHSTAERFFFRFEVSDSTLTLTEPFTGERDVDPEDRVEIFFAADASLSQPYYCAEMDPLGRVMDYKAQTYRQFDFDWNFRTLEVRGQVTPWGYRVAGSVSRAELASLGLDLEGGFWMGVFQGEAGDAGAVAVAGGGGDGAAAAAADGGIAGAAAACAAGTAGGEIRWYSLVPTDDATPDFHQPKVFFPCRMTPRPEQRGVVVYPGDVTSLGTGEWEKRIRLGGLRTLGLHAATSNDPIDSLEAFVRSAAGQEFLALCEREGVAVEYELHALETLLPRELFASHPEYFRMDETGERVADYNLCFSSEEAIEAMRPQLERLLAWMRPSSHRYFLWPDDKQNKYCSCERCRALSPSEQTLLFENRLLALLREYDPEATLAHLAYHQTLDAPLRVRATEGIFLEYAPILRDYADPLPEAELAALQDNLLAFRPATQHILEYWLDESMNARWKRPERPLLSFDPTLCARDVALYRRQGACSLTNFATWLDGPYVSQHGPTDPLFAGFAAAFASE